MKSYDGLRPLMMVCSISARKASVSIGPAVLPDGLGLWDSRATKGSVTVGGFAASSIDGEGAIG